MYVLLAGGLGVEEAEGGEGGESKRFKVKDSDILGSEHVPQRY